LGIGKSLYSRVVEQGYVLCIGTVTEKFSELTNNISNVKDTAQYGGCEALYLGLIKVKLAAQTVSAPVRRSDTAKGENHALH